MARKSHGDPRTAPRAPARDRREGKSAIPRPHENDFEDVHWALSAASTLWERGEDTEALKWLRRAASSAAERDADARAVELFKAAAEVASDLDSRPRNKRQDVPDSERPDAEAAPVPLTVPKAESSSASPPSSAGAAVPSRPSLPARAAVPSGVGPAPSSSPGAAPPSAESSPVTTRARPNPLQPASEGDPATTRAPRREAGPVPRRSEPKRARYGTDSTVVPPVPPEPAVSEALRPRIGLRFDESEEETFVRPETLVRRALMAIDPDYARRTDYNEADDADPDGASARTSSQSSGDALGSEAPSEPAATSQLGEDTTRRGLAIAGREREDQRGLPGSLPAVRVAVMAIPEERDVRLVFLPPDAEPPPGVAVALLVPLTAEDAQKLARLYADCDAKL